MTSPNAFPPSWRTTKLRVAVKFAGAMEPCRNSLRKIVNFCAIYGCSNRSNWEKDLSFFRIPKVIIHCDETTRNVSAERRQLLVLRINRKDSDLSESHHRVCSSHFLSGRLKGVQGPAAFAVVCFCFCGKRRRSFTVPSVKLTNPDTASLLTVVFSELQDGGTGWNSS